MSAIDVMGKDWPAKPSDVLSPSHSFSPCDIVGYVDDDSAPEVILAFMIYVTTFAREES